MSADALAALARLRERRATAWLGTMSGTSGDGIDVARVEIEATSAGPRVRAIAGETIPFPAALARSLRETLESPGDFAAAGHWDRVLGERFAAAAAAAIERHGAVDAIALSGHTFSHRPAADPPATLQLGSPFVVAERTGRPVLFGFRAADLARGGEGAPLVPAGDRILFGALGDPIAIVNIGGISNVTWLERGAEPRAEDAGAGNLLLDGAFREACPGRGEFDADGAVALGGRVDAELVARFGAAARRGARRSYGREEFGAEWLARERAALLSLAAADRLATLADWVAEGIHRSVERLGRGRSPDRVLVGGGGAHHRAVIGALSRRSAAPVEPLDRERHGVSADLREAAAFAILGHEWLWGRAGSFPSTTGTRVGGPLGALALPAPAAPPVARAGPSA